MNAARRTVGARLILWCSSLLSLAACSLASDSPPHAQTARALSQPFVETLPESAVAFTLMPVLDPGSTDPVALFWIGKTEVTWDMYDVFLFRLDLGEKQRVEGFDADSRPSRPYGAPDRGFGHAGHPAIGMTRHAARAFCAWLSQRTGRSYRLPTEAEWQTACCADASPSTAWTATNSNGTSHPVGTSTPDAFGLHDMLGNAAEWCDGSEVPVVRGGSFLSDLSAVSCELREQETHDWNMTDPQFPKSEWWLADCGFVGMRLVCEPEDDR